MSPRTSSTNGYAAACGVFLVAIALVGCKTATPMDDPTSLTVNATPIEINTTASLTAATTLATTAAPRQSNTPEARTPAATPARAAISLAEARRRTLAQLDPRSAPEITHAGAITAGALSEALESVFTQWDAWYAPANDQAEHWLYVVIARQRVFEANTFELDLAATPSPDTVDQAWFLRHRAESIVGIWEIESGRRLALGLARLRSSADSWPSTGDPQGFDRLTWQQIQPPPIASTTTPIADLARAALPTTDATSTTLPPAIPKTPFTPSAAPEHLQQGLRDLPLQPGYRRTYRYRFWEMGLGCSTTVTETVRHLDALPGGAVLAALDRRMDPGGEACLRAAGVKAATQRQPHILLQDRDIFHLPDEKAAAQLWAALDILATDRLPGPQATSPSHPDVGRIYDQLPYHDPWTSSPFPTWRLDTPRLEAWPTVPNIAAAPTWTWTVGGQVDVRTTGLDATHCTVATWGPNRKCCTRAFCPGLGIVLEHRYSGGSTWSDLLIELIDVSFEP